MGGMTEANHTPRAPVRSKIARALFERSLARLEHLEVVGPGDRILRADPGAPRMEITSERFFDRLALGGKIGFGEAYMAGEWRADDLHAVLLAFATRLSSLVPAPLQRLRRIYEPRLPSTERNTESGARRNIQRHYDLSNDLFALFLDPTMTYSCAIFEPGDSLAEAQLRKYRAIAELAQLEPQHHVLEIGTGWGGMAIHAATEIGCRVTTITISEQQHALALERVREAGVDDRVQVLLRDYRALEGRFDRIVSIEMFEALGEEYWPVYFAACDRLLAPGGRMALQTITMPDARYRASRRSYTWIHKYIFPGGLIPSEQAIDAAMGRASGLQTVDRRQIGRHYGPTLRAWRERFLARWDDARALGFDEHFRRMWEFYLAYCEAGFRTEELGDVQLALERR
jgi:cyclopropane-fatty-acyl-phospholipid synthase